MQSYDTSGVAEEVGRPPRSAPRMVRLACLLGLAGVLAGLFFLARPFICKPDFEYFYKAGAWMLVHGEVDPGLDLSADGSVLERGTLDWYLPSVSRFMTIFALMPPRTAGYVWLAMNLAALAATLRLLGRHVSGLPPRDWAVTQLAPVLLLGAYWFWEFRLHQIDNLTLLAIVGSFTCWLRGRPLVSGFWLGLAVLLKLTPGLLVVWLVLKRQYRAVAAAVVTVALAGPIGDAVALGPDHAAEAYRVWFSNAVTNGSPAGLIRGQREMDWRNQSTCAVLSRWLHPTNYATRFDNDPRVQAAYGEHDVRMLNIASLPLPVVGAIATAMSAISLVALAWLSRHPADRLSAWQLRAEWSLFLLAMLWTMPVMRYYHMTWATPAITVLGGAVHYAGWRRGWSRAALACIALAAVAQAALLYRPAEAAGVTLVSVAILAAPLVGLRLWLGCRPAAVPGPWRETRTQCPEAGRGARASLNPSLAAPHA